MVTLSQGTQNAIQFGAPVIVGELLKRLVSKSAGTALEVLGAIGVWLDVLDPMGYATTLTRSAIDQLALNQTEAVKSVLTDPTVRDAQIAAIRGLAPDITDDQLQEQLDRLSAYYAKYRIPVPTDCYSDATPTGLTNASLSGPPNEQCPEIYRTAYFAYVNNNEQRYRDEQIDTADPLAALYNGLIRVQTQKTIDSERNVYISQLIYISAVFGLLFLIILIVFLVARQQQQQQ